MANENLIRIGNTVINMDRVNNVTWTDSDRDVIVVFYFSDSVGKEPTQQQIDNLGSFEHSEASTKARMIFSGDVAKALKAHFEMMSDITQPFGITPLDPDLVRDMQNFNGL